jgi:hypothetical protein
LYLRFGEQRPENLGAAFAHLSLRPEDPYIVEIEQR